MNLWKKIFFILMPFFVCSQSEIIHKFLHSALFFSFIFMEVSFCVLFVHFTASIADYIMYIFAFVQTVPDEAKTFMPHFAPKNSEINFDEDKENVSTSFCLFTVYIFRSLHLLCFCLSFPFFLFCWFNISVTSFQPSRWNIFEYSKYCVEFKQQQRFYFLHIFHNATTETYKEFFFFVSFSFFFSPDVDDSVVFVVAILLIVLWWKKYET